MVISETLSVVTFLWQGDGARTYEPEHVNQFAAMVKKHLPLPHKCICVVDEPTEGFSDDVTQVVLPESAQWTRDLKAPKSPRLPSSYRRLWCFSKEARQSLGDRILQLDMDCLITGDMTPLFDFPDDFVGWRPRSESRTSVKSHSGVKRIAGGTWLLRTGTHTFVWDDFTPERIEEARRAGWRGSDQAWLSYRLAATCKVFPQRVGIYHTQDGARQWQRVPKDAIIIHFNGKIKPWDEMARSRRWYANYLGEPATPTPGLPQKRRRQKSPSPSFDLAVVCYWWGAWPNGDTALGLRYLRNLLAGVRAHLPETLRTEFVCITDAPKLVATLTDWQAEDVKPRIPGNLKKMQMYKRFRPWPHLCFDLDLVVTGDLAPLVELVKAHPSRLITCEAAYQRGKAGGSLIGWQPSEYWHQRLWSPVQSRPGRIAKITKGSERFYFRQRLSSEEMLFWQRELAGLVLSYKMDCQGRDLPKDTSVVRFHGKPRVHEVKDSWVERLWNH